MVKDEARQERLNQVFRHLFAHFGINSQIAFAEALHVQRTALSAAMNGNKAYLTNNLFTKICAAFPNVFNYDYLVNGEGDLLTVEEDVKSTTIEKQNQEIPEYVQRLCDEASRLSVRNEILERQCENLIAELRVSKDKNDAFLVELRKSQEFNDSLVAELKISRTQNETLITELRESRKKFDAIVKDFEELKDHFSMAISQHPKFLDEDHGILHVNDDGEPIIMIQLPEVNVTPKPKSKTKSAAFPTGYIKGNVKFITDKMVQQALAAFLPKKK